MSFSFAYTPGDPQADAAFRGMVAGLGGSVPVGGGVPAANRITAFADPTTGVVTIQGPPSLTDARGTLYQIALVAGAPVVFVNGVSQAADWSGHANGPVAYLLLWNGVVYCALTTGIWQKLEANGSWYNSGPPDTSAPPPTTGTMPPMPVPALIAPGSSGRIINCGSGQALATLSAAIPTAQAGDTIKLAPGVYTDTPPAWNVPLRIDLGGAAFNVAGKTSTLAHGKGLLVPNADSIIENGIISGVAMDQGSGQLTSAIRPDDRCGYLTIRNIVARGNQCGVGHGGFPIAITIEDSNLSGNGLTANSGALTHNLYVGSDCVLLTLKNVISTAPVEAHAIKYRGHKLIANGGTFAADNGSCINRPEGSTVPDQITGVTLVKSATAGDHKIIDYAEENINAGSAGMILTGCTIRADCINPLIRVLFGGTIAIDSTSVLTGQKIVAVGAGSVTGI